MAFLAQVSTQQVITKSISTVTLDVSSITGIVIGTLQPGDLTSTIQGLGTLGYISSASSSSTPSTLSTFAVLTSSITTSSLRIGQWPLEEAANIAINDPTAATTSSVWRKQRQRQRRRRRWLLLLQRYQRHVCTSAAYP